MLKLLYGLIVLLGTVFGVTLAFQVDTQILDDVPGFSGYSHPQILLAILLGGLGYLVTATISWELEKWCEKQLPKLRIKDIVWGLAGLVSGLVMATLFLIPLYFFVSSEPVKLALGTSSVFQTLTVVAPPFLTILFGYLGMLLFLKKQDESVEILGPTRGASVHSRPKVLDTSAIIDGRIVDLIRSGIIEGTILVPQYVLGELQYVSDAPDHHKRQRGKRGFAILESLKQLREVSVQFTPDSCLHIPEVDAKLLHTTRETGGVLITNDMNLHKLARLQEIACINLHDVSNALRPVVLPGEELELQIVKRGKEVRQGVGYLNDGTMIVVENGAPHIGTVQRVVVTSVLQTSAGRMIFARVEGHPTVSQAAPVSGTPGRDLASGT